MLTDSVPASIGPTIVKTPETCGGRARFAGTRIPVWLIRALWDQGESDAEVLQNYPELTHDHLAAARLYVLEHEQEIESDLRDQVDPPPGDQSLQLAHDALPTPRRKLDPQAN